MARWQAMGLTLPVSVNIGARQLQQSGFHLLQHFANRRQQALVGRNALEHE